MSYIPNRANNEDTSHNTLGNQTAASFTNTHPNSLLLRVEYAQRGPVHLHAVSWETQTTASTNKLSYIYQYMNKGSLAKAEQENFQQID